MDLPSYRWRFVHLAALWGFGVSQPVFSMLQGNSELLYLRGSTRTDAIVFAALLALVPPLVVVALEGAIGLVSRTLSDALHVVAVWALAFLAVLQMTRLLDVNRGAALLLPMVPAALIALLYLKAKPFRSFLSFSLLLPLVAASSFVATVPSATDDAAAADVQVRNRVPVVLVVFDEFPVSSIMRPDGSIDAVRYPNFGRLARSTTWYPNATSVAEATTLAVPAILTGMEPKHGQHPTVADHPDNLFTLLGQTYRINETEHLIRLCPKRYCPGEQLDPPPGTRIRGLFDDAVMLYGLRVVPRAVRGWRPLGNDRFDVTFANFLSWISPSTSRQLDFLHLSLPHAPWYTLPSGRQYQNPAGVDGVEDDAIFNDWGTASWLVDQSLQAHLLQVDYTDRLLGKLIHRLEATSLYDKALVIVTADHGAGFQAGGSRRAVRDDNLADIAGVPLFVKYPGQRRGRIDGRNAKTFDIVPTIAGVLGVRIPWHVDGVSLRGASVSRQVSVSKVSGGSVVASPAAVAAGVLATARRNAALFGVGRDPMYGIGPFKELHGQSINSLARYVAPAGAAGVVLDDQQVYENVRRSSGFVPARVAGAITGGSIESGTALAITVNGRVEATTRSYRVDGRARFVALVPEGSFHDGRNSVRAYAVERTGGDLRITSLGGTPYAPAQTRSSLASPVAIPSSSSSSSGSG